MEIILLKASAANRGGPPETNITGVYPPLGLAQVAACLREAGHDVQLIDAPARRWPAEKAAGQIPANFTGLLGFSTTTLNWLGTRELIRACKNRAPRARIIVGGPHLDLYPVETVSLPEVDFALIGEGDHSMPALVAALENSADVANIPGLVRQISGETLFGPPPEVVDLDELPFPAWDLLPLPRYRALTVLHPFATMVGGRGCPYKCRFCSQRYAGGKFHRMSPERLVREWLYLVKEIGAREIIHFDETFAIGEEYVAEVAARVVAAGGVIPNNVRARCDTLTTRMASALARTGTHTVHLGIEAGSDEALARMKKGITLNEVRTAVSAAKSAGLAARGYFMLAYPGDTLADALQTIELARALPLDLASFTITVLNPGTPIYEEALANGETSDYWGAFVRGEAVSARLPRARHGLGDERSLRRLLRLAYRRFYLRPRLLGRLVRRRRLWHWIPSWLKAVQLRRRS